jgi:FAD/FMN-containing dehydrogenase
VTAAELMFEPGLVAVERLTGLPHPLRGRHPAYLLLEAEDDDVVADLAALLDGHDTAVGASLWDYRERHTETVNALGVPHKLDVALPIGAVPGFCAELPAVLAACPPHPGATVAYVYGHLGDGNLHVNVIAPGGEVDEAVDEAVLRLVLAWGGSGAAEHGVGVAKAAFLPMFRSADELATQRTIKDALDPAGLLNPGVIFAG